MLLFLSPTQNDHLATNRQAEGPTEQSPGVPPAVHPAVLLKVSLAEEGPDANSRQQAKAKSRFVSNKCLFCDVVGPFRAVSVDNVDFPRC